jgi:hypothetical protein
MSNVIMPLNILKNNKKIPSFRMLTECAFSLCCSSTDRTLYLPLV